MLYIQGLAHIRHLSSLLFFLTNATVTLTNTSDTMNNDTLSSSLAGTWCVYAVEAPVGKVSEVIFHSFTFLPEQYLYRCWDFLEVRDSSIHEGEV